ncbi:hypothetical protein VNO77_36832 [Canavalia gladiata]|uniref:Uncharacterized protein n=1 Tax=Canavalia gladiata TaxID=3824 RepID=A0AAN9PVU7_CANGL
MVAKYGHYPTTQILRIQSYLHSLLPPQETLCFSLGPLKPFSLYPTRELVVPLPSRCQCELIQRISDFKNKINSIVQEQKG